MRAVLVGERFMSKCPVNYTQYSQNNNNERPNTPKNDSNIPPAKAERFVDKIYNYLKEWGKQFQPRVTKKRSESDGNNSELFCELQQKLRVPKITIITTSMRKHSTQPNVAQDSLPVNPNYKTNDSKTPPNVVEDKNNTIMAINTSPNGPKSKSNSKYARQVPKNLLTYPVMPLHETLKRYLASIRPFLTDDEYLRESSETVDFMLYQGGQLQKLLEDAGRVEMNWLTERWTHANYLRYRGPVTVFTSPCMAFPKQKFYNISDCLSFTAKAIYGMCEFKNLIDQHRIPVYTMDGLELDNSQFHNVFGTVRIPQRPCDSLQQCNSNYIVVVHRNNFHKVIVYTETGCIVSSHLLMNKLLKIVNNKRDTGPEIGLLTHDTRDNWVEAHQMISRQNSRVVHCIEQALFIVCLDKLVHVTKGQERSVMANQLLHGGGLIANSANRWMDKTLQLIVNPNGMVGFCYEHSPADPQPVAMLMDYVQKKVTSPEYGYDNKAEDIPEHPSDTLRFNEVDDCIEFWLSAAKRNINKISSRLKMHVFKFPCYGKCLIKSQGLPPDSYIQMALQLAFYRLHKELPAQYESAHLRIFKCGRTDAIRSTSMKSRDFVHSMVCQNASLRDRVLALRAAVDDHFLQMKRVLQGKGVDRHLFGLKQMAREHGRPLPAFFTSYGYLKSSNYRIVSSQVATPHDAFMAHGPLSSEAYGCCYNPREKDIIFAISSWNLTPAICAIKYGKAVELALADMGQLILESGGPDAAHDATECKKK